MSQILENKGSIAFHLTKKSRLNKINKEGLKRTRGENSKYAGEIKNVLCFSEGLDGALLMGTILINNPVDNFLDGIYLTFDSSNIKNERNFIDGRTSVCDIDSSKLSVLKIINKKTKRDDDSASSVFLYMMAKCDPFKNIDKLKESLGNKSEEEKQQRIDEVKEMYKKLYRNNEESIEKYKNGDYLLVEESLENNKDIDL